MKKLSKLNINTEKVMKNDELLKLKGGGCQAGDPGQYECFCLGIFAGCQVSASACDDRCAMTED